MSEITWTTGDRPQEIEDYWHALYPEIDTASAKIQVLERHGYSPVGYFVLPERCWLENYYRPLEGRFSGFLSRNASSEEARQVVESERREIALYEKYRAFYSYGFYLARKVD
ncbi:hypothetical protein [Marinobacterium aestuariivivens]|uniref:Methyltransferase n=1 Tax=Marinobacterium aestuariivivens TaxID=1698799 RepID=A0ABW2A638_9GAMM